MAMKYIYINAYGSIEKYTHRSRVVNIRKDGYTELVPNDIMKNPSETSVCVCMLVYWSVCS